MKILALFFALVAVSVASTPDQALADIVTQGGSSYIEFSRAFYGEQTEAVFAAKAAYQQAHPESRWLADYSVDAARRIGMEVRPANSFAFKGGADGCYDSRSDRILLKEQARLSPSDSIHELGHAVQRTRLLAEGNSYQAALRRITSKAGWSECNRNRIRYPSGIAKWMGKEHRFSSHPFVVYVCNNTEFEVRLQAMNRYYYAKTGRAIMSTQQGRECLALAAVEADPVMLRLYREVFELAKVRALILKEDGEAQAQVFWDDLCQLAPGHA